MADGVPPIDAATQMTVKWGERMQLELKIQRPKTKQESLEDLMRRAHGRHWMRERSRQLVCQ